MIRLLTYDGEKSSAVKLGFPVAGDLSGYVEDYFRDVIVRWGQSRTLYNHYGMRAEFNKVLNKREAIRSNCLKHKSTLLLSRVVRTPHLYTTEIPWGVTAVVRPFEHIAGSGFQVEKGPFEIPSGFYATEMIKLNDYNDMEVRVWFSGRHTLIGKRARSADRSEFPCRSEWGYEFKHVFDPELGPDTIRASKAIGLDCGAADIICRGGERFFLELNSAPSIDHWRIEDFFKSYIPVSAQEKGLL
jgi:hypothetical protein